MIDAQLSFACFAFFMWFNYSVHGILGLIAQTYKPRRAGVRATNVECVIVSVANRKVERSLFECIEQAKRVLKVPVRVVVDEGSELIDKLREELGDGVVIVPSSYRRDLVGKGRALNYFVEHHVSPDKWYIFLDDDNLVLDDNILYEIPYYELMGYAAANPVLVPRRGRSNLTYIMDHMRLFNDITLHRFFTGLFKSPLLGLHGELLTVRGSVLKEVGFGHRSLAEDYYFATELVKRGYRTWQSATRVSIKSPHSLEDLFKQRGRWFKGVLMNWGNSPLAMKAMLGFRLAIWAVGVYGWLLIPLWLLSGLFPYVVLIGLCYWAVYLYGIWKAGSILYLPLLPFFSVLESLSSIAGLRLNQFNVIQKD